jgi:hypothetical protein
MTTDPDLIRDIGGLEKQVEILVVEVAALRTVVAKLETRFAQIDGGKKALWGLLTAAGALGAFIAQIGQYFLNR